MPATPRVPTPAVASEIRAMPRHAQAPHLRELFAQLCETYAVNVQVDHNTDYTTFSVRGYRGFASLDRTRCRLLLEPDQVEYWVREKLGHVPGNRLTGSNCYLYVIEDEARVSPSLVLQALEQARVASLDASHITSRPRDHHAQSA